MHLPDVSEVKDESSFGGDAEAPLLAGWAAALLDRANLTRLVLGCIEAKFCKKICV